MTAAGGLAESREAPAVAVISRGLCLRHRLSVSAWEIGSDASAASRRPESREHRNVGSLAQRQPIALSVSKAARARGPAFRRGDMRRSAANGGTERG
jgi:hypothetical protein